MGLFLDIIHLSEPQTERALSEIYKSVHDHDDRDAPHESPFVRRIIELFHARGIARLEAVQAELLKWSTGKYHQPGAELPARPPGAMHMWSQAEQDLVRIYLRALPPGLWTLDDHMLMVDFVFQRYLPADALVQEAEWMATRSTLMGKVQANLAKEPTFGQADKILAALPNSAAAAAEQFALSKVQRSVLAIASAKGAEYVTNFADGARRQLRGVVLKHAEAGMLKVKGTPGQALQTELLDTFATLNRDWRRIAVTEAGNNALVGYIASLPEGSKVKRVEQYANACPHCRRIDGQVMVVVAPDRVKKDPDTMIWVGKDNYGRAAAPKKRVGDQLVARSPDELWWIPAGLMHPNCRGRWVPVLDNLPGEDPEFGQWLAELLRTAKLSGGGPE